MAGVAALVMAAPQVAAAQEPLPEAVGVVAPPDEDPVVSPRSSSEVVIGEDRSYDLDLPMAPLPSRADEEGVPGLARRSSEPEVPSQLQAVDLDSYTPSLSGFENLSGTHVEFNVRTASAGIVEHR